MALPASAQQSSEDQVMWDRVLLGMTEKEFQEAYPEATPGKENAEAPTEGVNLLRFTRFTLRDQRFGEIEHCRADVTFFQARVLQIDFRCRTSDREKVLRHLNDRYGFPTVEERDGQIGWMAGERLRVSYVRQYGFFGLSDSVRMQRALGEVQAYQHRQAVQQAPAPKPGPVGGSGQAATGNEGTGTDGGAPEKSD
jgi:hypothetical protein